MKLWQKNIPLEKSIEEFTIGSDKEMDLMLAEFDILGSLAHCKMLVSIGLLSSDELSILEKELKNIYQEIKNGNFYIQDGIEDVHSQVEFLLTQKLGDVGKKIHSGRSRNDQVLVDIKLFYRAAIEEIVVNTKTLFDQLITLSDKHKAALLPGYTHFQLAMPSSFGLWFGAYAEGLIDDMEQVFAAYQVTNKNPLGSAAGYGSSFPLNRQMTTDLLGFKTLNFNSVYAQMSRTKADRSLANAIAAIAGTLSKLSYDVCLFLNQNFAFISFPEQLTTGSSIMPHKKNPDVFELIRANCNRLQALPNEITLLTNNLPVGYHRDLQLLKECIFPSIKTLNKCLNMTNFMLENIEIKDNIMDDPKYDLLFSVESVNKEVINGLPFRDAYRLVSNQIAEGKFKRPEATHYSHEGSIGNLCNSEINKQMEIAIARFDFEKITNKLKSLLSD